MDLDHEHEHDLIGNGLQAFEVGKRSVQICKHSVKSGTYTEYHSVIIDVHRQNYHKTEIER